MEKVEYPRPTSAVHAASALPSDDQAVSFEMPSREVVLKEQQMVPLR